MDAIWIGVGVTTIALVCFLALVAALAAAIFLFGVPALAPWRLLGWP